MGKSEENDEFSLSSAAVNGEGISGSNAERGECSLICRVFKLRCFLALLLGISVFLSAVFWLPPFLNFADRSDLDLDPRYRGHTIVASFRLKRPVSFVEDNIEELEGGIYEDFGAANAKVAILSKESSGLNSTDIVFAIDPVFKNSISSAQLSLIRASFVSLVTRQFDFVLIPSLSGESSFFEVLKFPGGITISPPQIAYPLQKVQILFNFTLNNSILQIQENFEVLRNQLKYGLHLTNNENLYIRLTNSRGSTVAPPATVQTSVVLKVGVPSQPRLKQLAQTIRDSPARNLGLNNTVFGKVKQVSLSSVLQHSLSGDAPSPTPAPTPAPLPHHHHHHHYHHHHHNDHDYLPPTSAPSYSPVEAPQPVKSAPPPHRSAPSPVRHRRAFPSFAPAPARSYQASPPGAHPPFRSYPADPPGCRFRFRSRHFPKSPQQSPRAPRMPPRSYVASTPHPQAKPPTPVAHQISPSSPLPNVIYARVHPPSASEMDPGPPDKMPSVAPSPSSGDHITAISWVISLLVALLLHNCW
ncbi:uncharacterized protein LOC110715008 [Chenopodium quinoa]|uniref:uncharacterized protein LOC110715008 n=1 Tax=Chenopodium quinoa TaxID=63459 RepID=UPI000B786EAE|nr:uncharacterized protein LOC110715008 [Chenopodium quinoa]